MIYKTQILVTMSKHLNKNYLGIFEAILQHMDHICTNENVNLIYNIQADRSNSCDVEGGGFSFIYIHIPKLFTLKFTLCILLVQSK